MAVIARLAARAAVPVFPVVGAGGRHAVQDLDLRDGIEVVPTPRAADVVLLAGRLPPALLEAASRVHDQLPHPRATVWWTGSPVVDDGGRFGFAVMVGGGEDDVVAAIAEVHRSLLAGDRRSDHPILPQEPPAPWQGVGQHGQGGEGMMGGRPYGRPMPMTGPDRDGLQLDQVSVTIGPFLPGFPPGLRLDATLQGDVVQAATLFPNPFATPQVLRAPAGRSLPADGDAFARAEPVAVAELEVARARHHLRWLAAALRHHGLQARSRRVLALARRATPGDSDELSVLVRRISRDRSLRWATEGVGRITADALDGVAAGPVTRAAGVAADARNDHPAYDGLEFTPVTHAAGDAWARMRQRVAEAEQALRLAAAAGERRCDPALPLEEPAGGATVTDRLLSLLPDVLAGLEWGDAVTTIVSLDLDMEQAAVHAQQKAT